jgi:hypothetical protein
MNFGATCSLIAKRAQASGLIQSMMRIHKMRTSSFTTDCCVMILGFAVNQTKFDASHLGTISRIVMYGFHMAGLMSMDKLVVGEYRPMQRRQ